MPPIRRRFVDVSFGPHQRQVHFRECPGSGDIDSPPLVMLHAAPGSSLMLGPLQARLPMRTIAIDLPGMGDSDALPPVDREPEGDDYTAVLASALDSLSLESFDVYGTLSGVRVALGLAHLLPQQVRRVVLDGIGIPKPEDLPGLLEDYAPPFTPNINGTHFTDTFLLCRDQYLFYPWHQRDAAHRRPNGLPDASALHAKTMEALKSASGFRPLIRAAFRYPVAEQLKTLAQAALISADGATVRPDLPVLGEPPAEPLTASAENLDMRVAQITAFLR